MSDLRSDVFAWLTHGEPRVRRARKGVPDTENEYLRAQVFALQSMVALLASALERVAPGEAADIRRVLRESARIADDEDDEEEDGPALATSPYRGAAPGLPGLHCASCGKPIAEDDPELRSARGRVCFTCFQHG